jgi:hypothetical protein
MGVKIAFVSIGNPALVFKKSNPSVKIQELSTSALI